MARHDAACSNSSAGTVRTPAFMPVGTHGAVRSVTPEEVRACGAEIILGNTFHLMLRPGVEVVEQHGGLHRFMHWPGPILTDSGGYQVFSLAPWREVGEAGVRFRSPVDGDEVFLDPERSVAVQHALGADIVMAFDECTPHPATQDEARASMELSLRWAERSRQAHGEHPSVLFGIGQGGLYPELRLECQQRLEEIGFDGYAVGGLSVGESFEERSTVLEALGPHLPAAQPRLPDGCGAAGGYRRCGSLRHGSVRLRDSDPARPQTGTCSPGTGFCAFGTGSTPRRPGPWRRAVPAIPARTTRAPTCGTWTRAGRSCFQDWRPCTTFISTSS